MKFKTISSRIFTFVIPTIIITIISFATFSYYVSNARINKTIDEKMHESLQAADMDIQFELYKNAVVAEHFARYGKTMKIDAFDHYYHKDILAENIISNPNTFGGGVWFEPYAFDSDSYYFGPFLYIDDSGEIHYTKEYADYADYFNEDWYLSGKSSDGETIWSLVYYDPFSTKTMVTASKAFYDEGGRFIGMGTADMNIENIRKIVSGISVGNTGHAFIIGADGEYISFEGKNIGEAIQTDADETLAQLGKEILENDSGVAAYSRDGKKFRAYYMTMANVNWTLAVTIEESEIRASTLDSFIIMTVIPILGLALVISGIFVIVNYLRRIINKVNNFADIAASGDFSKQIDVTETDEFGFMEQRLNKMISNMSDMSRRSLKLLNISENTERLLYAVNGAATVLLSSEDDKFEESLQEGMELMARCVDVDRIYIWRNVIRDGVPYYTLEFGWLSSAGQKDDIVSAKASFSYHGSMSGWEKKFLDNECINGPLSSLPHTEHEQLMPFGIVSILVIPVYLQDRFWGFVSFDDCRRERTFAQDEVNILRSASLMMANAMIRNETAVKLREADERTRIMLDATPLSCSLFDKDYNVIDCNEEAVKLYELGDKQEYLDSFYKLSPEYQPDGQLSSEKAHDRITEAFEYGRLVFEWTHQKPDGTQIPAEVTLVRVRRGSENILAGYTRDLREYKKMMMEIEHKDILLQTVNNAASILLQAETDEFENNLWQCMGMMAESVGIDRMYIWKNHVVDGELYCTQLYEWSEGAEPQQGKEITIDTPYSEAAPGWEDILSAGQSINSIVRDMSPEEQASLSPQGIVSILVVPVFLREQFWGFVGFDDCRCERVFSADEESVLRSGSLLIAYALLRNQMTLDIRAAVETAQSASLAKSNFLSNMSHEMRTPMNAIIGMTAIGKSASDAKRKDYALGKIEDASNHLLGVINDILDISKIEASKFELSDIEFNFEKMLQKVVNVICFRVDEKKQRLTVFLDKYIPRAMIGDDQRLSQVIANLLSNAVKFTPEQGSIRLDTQLVNEENGVCTIQIEVTDTGIGISPDRYPRLFESFEQAERSTSRQYGGTGLGLAISKHIVELMDGNIWVESEPGKGSKFAFTVKLGRGADEPVHPVTYGMSRKNVKVLAVDDELETREYFASIAEQLGITCDTAAGGEDALGMISSKGSYNMYFVDWNMPEMNGIELSRKIKARDADRSVIIMISAIGWNEIEADAKIAGVDKFLPKPLFPSSIADCISEYLGLQSIREAKDESGEIISFKGYRLLLAEDVEINREIVKTILEPTQLEIDCAVNGTEAVQMFSDTPERYDMIFMDMQMPDIDGLEATRRIRSLGFAKAGEIPIIAMTANVFREDIEKCREAGMNDHIGKPLDFDDLFNKLYKYLQPKDLRITAPQAESTDTPTLDFAARSPVIDTADGIRRFMNNKALYLNTLVRFNGRQMADELISNIKSADFPGIIKSAHTLKGVSANLALTELQELVSDIEAKAKSETDCVDMVAALDEAINAVSQSIEMLVGEEDTK